MKIVIDGRMYRQSGIGRYIRNLISGLMKLDNKNEYYILHLKDQYDSLFYHTNFKKVLTDFRWYGASEQLKLPVILNRLKPDLVHFPHFNVPIFYQGKFVVTIHDLIHQHFQMARATTLDSITYKIKKFAYKKIFKNAVSKSMKILVPSSYVKDLLIREWKVNAEKIVVTHEAVDDKILSIENKMKISESVKIIEKLNIKVPYLFYVGNAHPHKNVEGLIKAFLLLQKKYHGLKLVLSGYDHYFWQRMRMQSQHPDIIYTGYVSDEELVALYKNASCFVMPSFEEGFGIPILEAMVCSCPVVSSNAASLPEIGGDAVAYFDSHNVEDVVDKISQVLDNEKLRKVLVEKGKKRIKLFSWKKLAKQTLEVYEKCLLP